MSEAWTPKMFTPRSVSRPTDTRRRAVGEIWQQEPAADLSKQTFQWVALSLSPIFFFLGVVLVERRREASLAAIRNMRLEFGRRPAGSSSLSFSLLPLRRSSSFTVSRQRGPSGFGIFSPHSKSSQSLFAADSESNGGPVAPAHIRTRRKDNYEEFFDAGMYVSDCCCYFT